MRKKLYLLAWLLLSLLIAEAQNEITVKGRVTNAEGKPLPGVLVAVKGVPGLQAITNQEGEVNIKMTEGNFVEISLPGGMSKTIRVNGEEFTVELGVTSREVASGFNISARAMESTAAISTVYADELNSSAINPLNALYGMLPGLSVMQGGNVTWNSDPLLRVRGIATLNNAQPLVLVDGFERPVNSLVLEEIESVSVIKDAAALALYGMRGANGVVLVTTKKGQYDRMNVKVSYQYGMTDPFRVPKMADASAYAGALNEALRLDGLQERYSSYDLADFRSGKDAELFPDVDWANEVLKDRGSNHQLNISFVGGGEKVRYFSLLNYTTDNGFLKPVNWSKDYTSQLEWDKISLRTNLDIDVTKSTNVKVNLLGRLAQHNRPTLGYTEIFGALYQLPAAAFPIRTKNGIWGGDNIHTNPVAAIAAGGYSSGHDRALFADMRIIQDLSFWVPGLSAEVAVAYDNQASYWEGKSKNYESEIVTAQRNENGVLGEKVYAKYGKESTLSYSHELGYQNMVTTLEGKVNYVKDWQDHSLNVAAIYHQEKNVLMGRNNTFLRQSAIGNIQYGLMGKYFFQVAMSYAGSSVMPEGDRFRFFPAVSAAWVASSEDFLSSSKWVNYLKIRASYGVTGSDLFDYELDRQYYGSGNNYYFGTNNNNFEGNAEGRLATKDMECEKSYKANIGIDARFFRNLSLTVDAFYEKRTNILVESQNVISSALGVSTPLLADGKVKNYGVEAALSWDQKIGDWAYELAGNFSFARNEIVAMNEGYKTEKYLKRTGTRIGQAFGLEAVGFFKDQAEIDNSPRQVFSEVRPGDIRFQDQNDDKVINEYDYVNIGNTTLLPEIYYGFNVGVSYKGIGVRADFQGVANYSVMTDMESMYWPLRNNTTVSDYYLKHRWTPEHQDAKYPRLTTLDNKNNFSVNSVWMENGAFLKLRNVEVHYDFPKNWMQRIYLSNARIFARGMNLCSFDKLKKVDPELLYADYPSFRSYHVGICVEF